jgi:hypothetical protein
MLHLICEIAKPSSSLQRTEFAPQLEMVFDE